MTEHTSSPVPVREQNEEHLEIHPTLSQRILALLGVVALISLFIALLYLLRSMG